MTTWWEKLMENRSKRRVKQGNALSPHESTFMLLICANCEKTQVEPIMRLQRHGCAFSGMTMENS